MSVVKGQSVKVFMTGGTGLVGTTLVKALIERDHEVTILTRGHDQRPVFPGRVSIMRGNSVEQGEWQNAVARHDVVINLAGASIFRRWSARARESILQSRVLTTRNLVEGILRGQQQMVLLSVSGIGSYGTRGDQILSESSAPGAGFLAGVAQSWETEAGKAKAHGTRVVVCRLGHVLGRGGGVLPRLARLSRWHAGSEWGTGRQWLSWVHERDMARAFLFLIEGHELSGPFNITSPHPVRNAEMMEAINLLLGKRPYLPPIPTLVLRTLLGEFASVFVDGQRVVPARLESAGFTFDMPSLDVALRDLLGP
jgi:hypothetical protein